MNDTEWMTTAVHENIDWVCAMLAKGYDIRPNALMDLGTAIERVQLAYEQLKANGASTDVLEVHQAFLGIARGMMREAVPQTAND